MQVLEFAVRFVLVAAFTMAAQAVVVPAMPTIPEALVLASAAAFAVVAMFR